MDKIHIRDLEIYCHHGVLKEENVLGQKFLVSVTLYLDTSIAGNSDNISLSVNYAELSHYIENFMKENTYQLIEAVAENLARQILLEYPLVQKLTLEIKKPWAPILLPIENVSVEIERGWSTVYLSIGSNMGEKEENLQKAIQLLSETKGCKVKQVSKFLITKPVGNVEQDDFLNGAVECKTLLTPEELLKRIHEIEKEFKRERLIHWGPRTIDLDIIFYDSRVIQTESLVIPHKEMKNREFVLEPLSEIAPYTLHPVYKKTVLEMWEEIKENKSEGI